MDIETLLDRLDGELRTGEYAEVDASANGLQVGSGAGSADRIAFAVDAAVEPIEAAAQWGADLLVVHHGLSWGGIDRVTGRTYRRIDSLIEHDIDLYVAHLPLDGHQELGNAAGVADVLELENRQPFGELGSVYLGQRGECSSAMERAEIESRLETALDHGGHGVRTLAFGPERVEEVAIVTGSGTDWFDEAVTADVDAFVTGEAKGKLYHMAKESEVSVFLGGHYATETFGIEALADLVGEMGPETRVFDAPTGL